MTDVMSSAYIAALHKKLAQAERSLYEFRQIFQHLQSQIVEQGHLGQDEGRHGQTERVREVRGQGPSDQGDLYPGQLRPLDECEE